MHTKNIANSTVFVLVSSYKLYEGSLADTVVFSACDRQQNLQVGPLLPDGYLLLDVFLCPSFH
jgi:hypothetical protein